MHLNKEFCFGALIIITLIFVNFLVHGFTRRGIIIFIIFMCSLYGLSEIAYID